MITEERYDRRLRQYRIERLLGELDARRRDLYRRHAGGVRPAGLRDAKRELRAVRGDLRDAVGTSAPRPAFMRLEGATPFRERPRGRRPLCEST